MLLSVTPLSRVPDSRISRSHFTVAKGCAPRFRLPLGLVDIGWGTAPILRDAEHRVRSGAVRGHPADDSHPLRSDDA